MNCFDWKVIAVCNLLHGAPNRQEAQGMVDINARIFECRSASTDPRCGYDVLAQGVILV